MVDVSHIPPPDPERITLRMGARGSLLSRMQSQHVAMLLQSAQLGGGAIHVELVVVTTSGDRIQDKPLHEFGGKGLFTKELEQAILRREIDFAVHSYKDVPVTMPLVEMKDLWIAAVPEREDPRDVLVGKARSIAELPKGARVGSSSLRRQAQLLALRPDLHVEPIRGNIDTRLRKCAAGEFDATILAYAGLKRAELFDPQTMTVLPNEQMLPAAGQGALAVQCRADNSFLRRFLDKINHPPTAQAVRLEREVVRLLNGDCHSPIAALATLDATHITLEAAVAARDGKPPVIRAVARLPLAKASEAPLIVHKELVAKGATQLLAG